MDRQQVATDIGMIAKMLSLDSMMMPLPQAFDDKNLYDNSQKIREITSELTCKRIGTEEYKMEDGRGIKSFSKFPNELDKYVDYASMIVAKIVDGVMAARFSSIENIDFLKSRLEDIDRVVSQFNMEANNVHSIANITYVDNVDDSIKKLTLLLVNNLYGAVVVRSNNPIEKVNSKQYTH